MSLDYKALPSLHPGGLGSIKQASLRVPEEDGLCSWLPANLAALFSGQFKSCARMSEFYTAGQWTITTGGTGDAQAQAVTPGGGVLITFASDDNFDTTLDSVVVPTLPSGKRFAFVATLQISDATGLGFKIGFSTGGGVAALPFGTNYTDFLGFEKPIASATMVSAARGNSGTSATGTGATIVAATEVTIGMYGIAHATTPSLSFYVGTPSGGGTIYGATANQLAQLAAYLTTPPTTLFTIHGTGVTGTNPTMTVRSLLAGVEA